MDFPASIARGTAHSRDDPAVRKRNISTDPAVAYAKLLMPSDPPVKKAVDKM